MSDSVFFSRFSPNRTAPKDLEAITVGRERILKNAVDSILDSTLTENKHHHLYIGARGTGKTHLITIINNRLSENPDTAQHLRIAWLNEDEASSTLLEILLRIYQALSERYPEEFPSNSLEDVYDAPPEYAQEMLGKLLIEKLNSHTLLVLIENLDAIFLDMKEDEQIAWRSFIQNHPVICTIATAQRLFQGVSDQACPFYGFFHVEHLQPFSVDDAVTLLHRIATIKGDVGLASFLDTRKGKVRVRALHHLSGGNQRLYIILSDFITKSTLEDLVRPFEILVDEQLTPFFQERLRWLKAPLQRRIVELLCKQHAPISVKDIARELFTTNQSISSQLKDLREIGYVESRKRGRESLYELKEPLMRLSFQIKDAKHEEPLRLIVDFLRIWYDREELNNRLIGLHENDMDKVYWKKAITLEESAQLSLRCELLKQDAGELDDKLCTDEDLDLLEEVAQESGDEDDFDRLAKALVKQGMNFWQEDDLTKAKAKFSRLIGTKNISDSWLATTFYFRGLIFDAEGNLKKAISDYSSAINIPGSPSDFVIDVRMQRGQTYKRLNNLDKAILDYTSIIEMSEASAKQKSDALIKRAHIAQHSGNLTQAHADLTSIINMDEVEPREQAKALGFRGKLFTMQDKHGNALMDFTRSLEIKELSIKQRASLLLARGISFERNGDRESALQDCTHAINIEHPLSETTSGALLTRGFIFEQNEDYTKALKDFLSALQTESLNEELISYANIRCAIVYIHQDQWDCGLKHIGKCISGKLASNVIASSLARIISLLFISGQDSSTWLFKANRLIGIFSGNSMLPEFGSSLVMSLQELLASDPQTPLLRSWLELWEAVGAEHEELTIPLRLFATGIKYIQSENPSTLLDLPIEERAILMELFELDEEELSSN